MAKRETSPERLTLLDIGWAAHANGDALTARRAYQRLLAGTPTERDESAAKPLAKALGLTVKDGESLARAVAAEALDRTGAPARSYLFVLMGAVLYAVMLVLASLRGG